VLDVALEPPRRAKADLTRSPAFPLAPLLRISLSLSLVDRHRSTLYPAFDAKGGPIASTSFSSSGRIFAYAVTNDWSGGHMSNKPDFVNKVYLHPCKDEVRRSSRLAPSSPPRAGRATSSRQDAREPQRALPDPLLSTLLLSTHAGGQEAQQEVSAASSAPCSWTVGAGRARRGRSLQGTVDERARVPCIPYDDVLRSRPEKRASSRALVESESREGLSGTGSSGTTL